MKLYKSLNEHIALEIGEDYKYIPVLVGCSSVANLINWPQFKTKIDLTKQGVYYLRKRLIEKAIIAKGEDGMLYFNPAIASEGESVPLSLWKLFEQKNEELY